MSAPSPPVALRPGVRMLTDGSVGRTELVTPAMCGQNSLFFGQLGDWTWDAVAATCGTDVYRARGADGSPAYLSFYYFRVRGDPRLHPLQITFGDRLQVSSRVFQCGAESVLTLHRIRHDDGTVPAPVEPAEVHRHRHDGCLYVENFNRWISRSRTDSNRDLVRAAPAGFRPEHLPRVPDEYSPRRAYAHARSHGSFLTGPPPGRALVVPCFTVDYPVEVSRDLNGVGLLYFASYFSILDWALLRLWRQLGRTDPAFLSRRVLDQRVCYLGNVDGDAVVRVDLGLWRSHADPGDELVEAVLRDRADGRRLAVSAIHLRRDEAEETAEVVA